MAGQLRDLVRARQALAGARERTRIARELHDSVKQQVFAASMRLGAARSAPPEQVDVHLASAESLVHQAQQELSDLIHELRPVAVEGRPLDEALRALADGYGGSDGPTLALDLEPGLSGTPEVGTALYRIAQEAISNALRHAGAAQAHRHVRRAATTTTWCSPWRTTGAASIRNARPAAASACRRWRRAPRPSAGGCGSTRARARAP